MTEPITVDTGWPSDLEGTWETVSSALGIEGRMVLHLVNDANGEPIALVDLLAIGGVSLPLANLRVHGGTIEGDVGRGHLRLHNDGWRLIGTWGGREGSREVQFLREHPAAVCYRTPIVSPDGVPTSAWSYRAPMDAGDGWPTGTLRDPSGLAPLGDAIVSGTYPHVDAVLLARDGQIVVDEYFHGYGPKALHTFQSVTKGVTSVLFGILVDRGYVKNLDDPVWKYLSHREGHRWIDERYDATLHDLLSMTVGLEWNEDVHYTDPRNDNTRMNASGDSVGYTLDRPRRPDWERGRYEYQSGLAILLGAVIHAASGSYVDEFATEHLFAPLGIDEFRWLKDPDGTRHTGGGLFMRPRDMLKVGQLLLDDGTWDGRRIVSEDWIRRSTTVQSHGNADEHGYQWWLGRFSNADREVRSVTHGGYGGQYLHVFRDERAVVVLNAHDYFGDGSGPLIVQDHLLPLLLDRAADHRT